MYEYMVVRTLSLADKMINMEHVWIFCYHTWNTFYKFLQIIWIWKLIIYSVVDFLKENPKKHQ